MVSPTGIKIIAVSCHTVDGQGAHKVPGNKVTARDKFKAQCATNIIARMVRQRKAKRKSQGQHIAPSLIMAGDLNVTGAVFKQAMAAMDKRDGDTEDDGALMAVSKGNLYAIADWHVDLRHDCMLGPPIKGADKRHEACWFDVTIGRPCESTDVPGDRTHVGKRVLEQASRVQADLQCSRAAQAARAATQGQEEDSGEESEPDSESQSQEEDGGEAGQRRGFQ